MEVFGLYKAFAARLGGAERSHPASRAVAPRSGAGSRGEAPVPFLSPFLCGTTKNEHKKPHSERAQQGEPQGVVALNLATPNTPPTPICIPVTTVTP